MKASLSRIDSKDGVEPFIQMAVTILECGLKIRKLAQVFITGKIRKQASLLKKKEYGVLKDC